MGLSPNIRLGNGPISAAPVREQSRVRGQRDEQRPAPGLAHNVGRY